MTYDQGGHGDTAFDKEVAALNERLDFLASCVEALTRRCEKIERDLNKNQDHRY